MNAPPFEAILQIIDDEPGCTAGFVMDSIRVEHPDLEWPDILAFLRRLIDQGEIRFLLRALDPDFGRDLDDNVDDLPEEETYRVYYRVRESEGRPA
jgi:hypothetical protein